MQDAPKAVWSIPYVSVAFFLSLKHNFIAYRSSSRPDCIFEIHQLRQSGFSRVYSNSCCSCSFEQEIIRIGRSSREMYSNNIVNFQESTTIQNAGTKKVWKLIEDATYNLSISSLESKVLCLVISCRLLPLSLLGLSQIFFRFPLAPYSCDTWLFLLPSILGDTIHFCYIYYRKNKNKVLALSLSPT